MDSTMMKKLAGLLFMMSITANTQAGLKATLTLNQPLENHVRLEWDPTISLNIASIMPIFQPIHAVKQTVIEFILTHKLSPADEEQCKVLCNLFNTQKPPKKVSIDAKARTLASPITDILQNLKTEQITIKYVTDEPLEHIKTWTEKWMIRAQNVSIELPEYKGMIHTKDLLRTPSTWLTTRMSSSTLTTFNVEEPFHATLTVHPRDIVRSMFSPEGIKNHQEWSDFFETYAAQNGDAIDYNQLFMMPEHKVAMSTIDDLNFFMKWYKNRDFSVYLDDKTVYNPKKNQLTISTEYLKDIARSDSLRSLLSSALNETSHKNTANRELYIDNWEDCLKLPHIIRKKTAKKNGSTKNFSIEKLDNSTNYVLSLWLNQSDVIAKNTQLSEADKDELINELGHWSKPKLEQLGVDVPALEQRQKEIGRTLVKESKRRFFERKSNSSQED